jgi:hypothetical protein
MINVELTGETRHRVYKSWFGDYFLVLQVQERVHGYEPDGYGTGRDLDYLRWRDAKVEDKVL